MTGGRPADVVVLTRFNLPTRGVESLIRAGQDWLVNRIGLFERYCLPSVVGQTDRDLHWLIYLDPASPGWLMDRLRPSIHAGVFVPITDREEVGHEELLADIGRIVGAQRRADLITMGLDNDDALATDFIARLRAVEVGGTSAIYFRHGVIRSGPLAYTRSDPSNAFPSVRSAWSESRTCWDDWHNRLGRHMDVRVVGGPPAWLQVVHGQNVSNRVRGRLTAPSRYRALFPGLLDDLADPGPRERARDLLADRPARFVRESARGGVKRAALAVLGKERFDRAKHGLRTVRSRVRKVQT